MLSNSVIAGGLAAGYLAVLVLQINPQYPIDPAPITELALMLGAAYGINLAVVFYALIVFRQILAVEVLSPGWVSVRLLAWLLTMAASGGAAAMWLNLRELRLGAGRRDDAPHGRRRDRRHRGGGGVPDDRPRPHQPARRALERHHPRADGADVRGHADGAARAGADTGCCLAS